MSAVGLSAMMTQDEFLEHAGVKGMKWGKRRQELKDAKAKMVLDKRGKDVRSEDTKKAGKEAVGLALGAIGALTISKLSGSPALRLGSKLVGSFLAGSAIGSTVVYNNSKNNDILNEYGTN